MLWVYVGKGEAKETNIWGYVSCIILCRIVNYKRKQDFVIVYYISFYSFLNSNKILNP